ncbi:hypothetical protein ACSTLM_04310 [Vibrio parahaemolyticus]
MGEGLASISVPDGTDSGVEYQSFCKGQPYFLLMLIYRSDSCHSLMQVSGFGVKNEASFFSSVISTSSHDIMLICRIPQISKIKVRHAFSVSEADGIKMFETRHKMTISREKWGKFGAIMGQIKHAILNI